MRSIEDITGIILGISSMYDIDEIYIFGSYARGEADEISDIDIAINAPNLSAMQLSSLSYKIEVALGLDVDLITMDAVDEEFLKMIDKEAVKVL